jgi:ADP-ribosylation factor-like protein 1
MPPVAGVLQYRMCVKCSVCALLQDLPGALSDAEVAEGLGLPQIKNRDWSIFKTSAVKGDGLFEGEPP